MSLQGALKKHKKPPSAGQNVIIIIYLLSFIETNGGFMSKNLIVILVIAAFAIMAGCATTPAEPRPTPPPAAPGPAAPVQTGLVLDGARNYTVASGDTLSDIAARLYGQSNMFYFPLIRLANANVVSNPDEIEPGTNLVIPNLQPNLNSDGAKALIRADMLSTAAQYDRQNMPQSAAELRRLANRL